MQYAMGNCPIGMNGCIKYNYLPSYDLKPPANAGFLLNINKN